MNMADINRKLEDNDRLINQLMANARMANARDSDANFDAIQARADDALQAHGRRAGRPMLGEPVLAYRRRMANELKKCSPKWKDFPIDGVRADAFEQIEAELYQDAAIAAKNPDRPGR